MEAPVFGAGDGQQLALDHQRDCSLPFPAWAGVRYGSPMADIVTGSLIQMYRRQIGEHPG
jgi:hypothetical protein